MIVLVIPGIAGTPSVPCVAMELRYWVSELEGVPTSVCGPTQPLVTGAKLCQVCSAAGGVFECVCSVAVRLLCDLPELICCIRCADRKRPTHRTHSMHTARTGF